MKELIDYVGQSYTNQEIGRAISPEFWSGRVLESLTWIISPVLMINVNANMELSGSILILSLLTFSPAKLIIATR